MNKNVKKKALWWFTPSLLEPCDGPWGRVADFGHDRFDCWTAIVDWLAARRVDRIFTGIEPYFTDRVVNQWGFHYVCRFPDDPAARCFEQQIVDENAELCRRICAMAAARGVRIGIHHYNLMAPVAWIEAHPAIHRKWQAVCDPVWGRMFRPDRMGFLGANLCWSDPDYRRFLRRTWVELFERIPELSGILLTAGEFSFCGCEACSGGLPVHVFSGYEEEDPEARRAEEERKLTIARHRSVMSLDLIKAFQGTMQECGRESVVRTWVIKHQAKALPVQQEYAVKFSVFDACHGGPDPALDEWLALGHSMWETAAIEAENCGPLLWHDEQWCVATAGKLNALPTVGTIVHINHQWGHQGHSSSAFACMNIERFLDYLEPVVASPATSVDEFHALFGPEHAPDAIAAARDVAAFPLNMTALVHLRGEGFSWGMPPWFDGAWRWPGVLGSANYDAPPWANPEGWTTFLSLIERIRQFPSALGEVLPGAPDDVLGVLDQLGDRLQATVRTLAAKTPPCTATAKTEWGNLRLSARLAELAAREYAALLRARLAWEACKQLPQGHPEAGCARQQAIEWMDRCILHLRAKTAPQLELARRYPALMPQIADTLRDPFFRLSHSAQIRIREKEKALIVTTAPAEAARAFTLSFWDFLPAARDAEFFRAG